MNTRTAITTLSILGSLTTIGFLVSYLIREEEEDKEKLLSAPPVKKNLAESVKTIPVSKPDKKVLHVPVKEEAYQQESTPMLAKPVQTISKPFRPALPLPVADEFPLRLGSKGYRVGRLKVFLLRNYGHTGILTDVFDKALEERLLKTMGRKILDEKTYKRYRMAKPVHEQVIIR